MIARIALPIIVVTILCYTYLYYTFLRKGKRKRSPINWRLIFSFVFPVLFLIATVLMARTPDYFPARMSTLVIYLYLLICGVATPVLFCLLHGVCRLFKLKRRWAVLSANILVVGVPLAFLAACVYGHFIGFAQFEVKRVELAFDDLPPAFDGYRIVQFSDAHVGTYTGKRAAILARAVDSINAQHADMVAFTGDLQNMRPEEIEPHMPVLGSIKARDGVFSVLGNHDYAEYTSDDDYTKVANMGKTISLQEDMGWKVLRNTFFYVRRGNDSIVVSGMENDGEGRFPQLGDLRSALYGLKRSSFVVMLEHDPTSWRRKILPHSHAQLTLSGHTHGGQINLFGWSPAACTYREYDGLYEWQGRKLYVSKGLGGVIPFRLGTPGEIVVITLRKK